ncbi:MAG: glutamate--tRNA ligase family protein [Acidobacteriota bacterium]
METSLTRLTRFAPAPTGFLHLGHVVNAIYVWGWGGRTGARVVLRIEDHDRQRSRPAFEEALLDDLDWLGFVPDEFGTKDFRHGTCASRQSDRGAIYAREARSLIDRGLVYGCTCSRHDLTAIHAAGLGGDGGRCRHAGHAPEEHLAWRLVCDDTVERFEDALHGVVEQRPFKEHGDVVIRDRHGNWTYQFAVVVDDHFQGIDLVARGDDLLSSTGLQIALGRTIGRPRPAHFLHHPLATSTSGRKLSKSDGDTGIRNLRAHGWTAPDVIGEAAHIVGLLPTAAPLPASSVANLFL